jgi:TonB family protein
MSGRPVILRAAATWGTSVLAVRHLSVGKSVLIGDGDAAIVPRPDGASMAESPIAAVGKGWEVDARGATGGLLCLRGRPEDPVELGRSGAPIPIVAGDYGLLQYGSLGVFFQFTDAAPPLRGRRRIDWLLIAAFVFSLVTVGGGLTFLAMMTTPRPLEKPLELTSQERLAVLFRVEPPVESEPELSGKDARGLKDPGEKDPKPAGGGQKAKGTMGALGRKGLADETRAPGEPGPSLGAMSDVLASDVGAEVLRTLGSIASVADALGGLRSDSLVLGRGPGSGLQGSGSGGGGDTDGVVFGAGTLDTGLGPGKGGGLGAGADGLGGLGRGGQGRGGDGEGSGPGGGGTGEKKIAGSGSSPAGQGLTPAQIQRVVTSRYGAFRACYESAAARTPGLQGGVTVSWSITPSGSVSGARIASSSLGNPRVEGCILRQVNRLRFPQADKATGASYPFLFKPGKK